MEKRVTKLEADQADMKMILLRIVDSQLALVEFKQEVRDRFTRIDDVIGQIKSELADMKQTAAEHHKETIGFLSTHKRED